MSKNAVMPLTDYQNACDAIREKTGTTDLIKSGEMAEKIMSISGGGGGGIDYDLFWDTYQENGNRTVYQYGFARSWTDDIYNPKYPIICNDANVYTAESLFANSKITDTKVPITITGTRMDAPFQDCLNLKRIPSLTINNIVRFTTNTFRNCRALEELNVYGTIDVDGLNLSYSPKLTKASILTVLNALKDFATKQTVYEATFGDWTDAPFDIYTINEGETYFLTFKSAELDDFVFEDAPAVVKPMNINGVDTIGAHYETDYWADSNFTYNVDLYRGGIDDTAGEYYFCERRYIKDKATGNIELLGVNGDEMTIKKRGTVTETHTVTLGATNLAKLSDADKLQATEKGWTLL